MIRLGSTGADVVAWQKAIGVAATGTFDAPTDAATRAWQAARGLTADGIVGPKTIAAAGINPEGLPYPFIEAVNLTRTGTTSRDVRAVVIHTMECQELAGRARWCAEWFADRYAPKYPAPRGKFGASAHYFVDDAEIVQGVRERDYSWHAGPVNPWTIGVEHAGFARQTSAEWADDYSRAVLDRSARLVAGICSRWKIPIVHLSVRELAGAERGIVGHIDVTKAFSKNGQGHYDPGPNFPWDAYLDLVRSYSQV